MSLGDWICSVLFLGGCLAAGVIGYYAVGFWAGVFAFLFLLAVPLGQALFMGLAAVDGLAHAMRKGGE